MSEKSRVGAFCQWRESQNYLFSPLCREPLSNTLSNPYGFWPFSTKWVDKVHDKGPRTPFVGRLLQKVSGAENFVGSLCRNLCRIGHFSIQASTKFATKMQNQHFRNRLELAQGRLRFEAIYLARGLFFPDKPRELIWINDNVITFGGY